MKLSMPLPLSTLTQQANQLKKLPQSKGVSDDAKLREVANDFEAIFIQQMLKTMRKTSFESDLLPKSEGEKVFQSPYNGILLLKNPIHAPHQYQELAKFLVP